MEQPTERDLTVPKEHTSCSIQVAKELERHRVLSRGWESKSPTRSLQDLVGFPGSESVGEMEEVIHLRGTHYSRTRGHTDGMTSSIRYRLSRFSAEDNIGTKSLQGNRCIPCIILHSCHLPWDLRQLSYEWMQ